MRNTEATSDLATELSFAIERDGQRHADRGGRLRGASPAAAQQVEQSRRRLLVEDAGRRPAAVTLALHLPRLADDVALIGRDLIRGGGKFFQTSRHDRPSPSGAEWSRSADGTSKGIPANHCCPTGVADGIIGLERTRGWTSRRHSNL